MNEIERYEELINKGYTYDHLTGFIYKNGKVRGTKTKRGYLRIHSILNGKSFIVNSHRFCWYFYHKTLPLHVIDHINGDKSDNRIENLRDIEQQKNTFNKKNVKGYFIQKKIYRAVIVLNRKRIELGNFNTEEEARNAYLEAKIKYHTI